MSGEAAEAGKSHRFLDIRDPSVLAADTPTHRKQSAEYWRARSRVAEARCARLQQAAQAFIDTMGKHHETGEPRGYTYQSNAAAVALWEVLAGPDTPADSQEHDPETLMDSYIAADSRRCECGHNAEHHYMESAAPSCHATVYTDAPLGGGSAYPCPCRSFVPADSQEDKT